MSRTVWMLSLALSLITAHPVYALSTGRLDLISRAQDGSQFEVVLKNVFAGNGRNVYLRLQHQHDYVGRLLDLSTGEQTAIPLQSSDPHLGGDGERIYATFQALDLRDTNQMIDLYRYAPTPELISVGDIGQIGDSHASYVNTDLSGQRIVFKSFSTNMVSGTTTSGQQLYVRDLTKNTTTRLTQPTNGCPTSAGSGAIDPTGLYIALTNYNRTTTYVWDAGNETCTTLLAAGAVPYNIDRFALSRNASYAILSGSSSRGQALWIDLRSMLTKDPCITPVGESRDCTDARLSPDGRYVAFVSSQPDLVAGDTNQASDIFVRDMMLNQTILASRPMVGPQEPGKYSNSPTEWAVDNTLLFLSNANTLVEGDVNNSVDSFRWFPDYIVTYGFESED